MMGAGEQGLEASGMDGPDAHVESGLGSGIGPSRIPRPRTEAFKLACVWTPSDLLQFIPYHRAACACTLI
jgi:hypothetical protein